MGVDHLICSSCGEVFSDSEEHGYCEACSKSWCEACNETKRAYAYFYDGTMYCTFCKPWSPAPITDSAMLDYALSLLQKSRDQVREEMQKLPLHSEPRMTFTCKSDRVHECSQKCALLCHPFYDPELEGYFAKCEMGVCCRARAAEPNDPASVIKRYYDYDAFNDEADIARARKRSKNEPSPFCEWCAVSSSEKTCSH